MVDSHLLRDHPAQAHAQHVRGWDLAAGEYGDDVSGQVAHGEPVLLGGALPGAAAVDQHDAELALEFREDRYPARPVEAQARQ